uniref:Uncharacterized protein n=1 Tax=viral metagenome TaxID=1070528 RepID=A0A6C0BVT8_9ZZZZ
MEKKIEGTKGSKTDGSENKMKSKNVIPILFVATHGCYTAKRDQPTSPLNMDTFNTPTDMNIVKLNASPLSTVSNNNQELNDIDVLALDLISYMDNPDDTRSLSKLLNDAIGKQHLFHSETKYEQFKGYEDFLLPFQKHHENDNMFSYSELPGNSVMYDKYYAIHLEPPTFDESKTNEENDKEFDEWYNTSDLRWKQASVYGDRLIFFKPSEEHIPYDEGFEGTQGVRRGRDILNDVRRYISETTGKELESIQGVYLSRVIDFLYKKENVRDLLIIDTSCSVLFSNTDDRFIIDNAEKDAEDIGRINEGNKENRIKVSARGTEPPIDPDKIFLGKYGGKRTKKNRRTKRRKSKKPTRRRKPTRKIRRNKLR